MFSVLDKFQQEMKFVKVMEKKNSTPKCFIKAIK